MKLVPGEKEVLERMGDRDGASPIRMERDIALADLPAYWSRRHETINFRLMDRTTRRCINEYAELIDRHSPDGLDASYIMDARDHMAASGAPEDSWPDLPDPQAWKEMRDRFFETVRSLETFDFRAKDCGCRVSGDVSPRDTGVITPEFGNAFPEYREWCLERAVASLPGDSEAKASAVRQAKAAMSTPGGLAAMDLSRKVEMAAQSAYPQRKPVERKRPLTREERLAGLESVPDEDYMIPDEEAERRRGDLGDE